MPQTARGDPSGPALRDDPTVGRWLARFETQQRHFSETVAAWERVEVDGRQVPNDHSDAEHDARVLARVDAVVVRMSKLIDELATKAPQVSGYRDRLEAAFDRADEGDVRYVSDPAVESISTIWSEFREDVFDVLGREHSE